jgi:hypothetical protein
MQPALFNLEDPGSWPEPVTSHLDRSYDLFLDWETRSRSVDVLAYDTAIQALVDALRLYAIVGWHCTRLTEAEINCILSEGMRLPDPTTLEERIEALVADGEIPSEIALRLKTKNQSGDWNRAGRLWFCFFPPRLAGESGIGRFFRHWGGEALYNLHEDDPEISPVIGAVGTPCVVEAEVPIVALGWDFGLAVNVVRRYLLSRGLRPSEPLEHEGRMTRPLSSQAVRYVHRFPGPEFEALTGCASWHRPIGGGA